MTHTLLGACLAATPAARRISQATPALILGANLPDLDVLSYVLGGDFALGFRRGWTHGWPALLILPLFLFGALLVRKRWKNRAAPGARADPRLLGLCYLAVASHPCLDWLNTYGMRWRMPLDGTWYYGDSVFIVDPWLWAVLAGGWWLGRRAERTRSAAIGLALAVLWIGGLVFLHERTESRVRQALIAESIQFVDLMVGPMPANPLVWDIVAATGDTYRLGRFRWPAARLDLERTLPDARADPRWPALAAAAADQAPGFLAWVRFPWLEPDADAGATEVFLMDARYVRRRTTAFGGVRLELTD